MRKDCFRPGRTCRWKDFHSTLDPLNLKSRRQVSQKPQLSHSQELLRLSPSEAGRALASYPRIAAYRRVTIKTKLLALARASGAASLAGVRGLHPGAPPGPPALTPSHTYPALTPSHSFSPALTPSHLARLSLAEARLAVRGSVHLLGIQPSDARVRACHRVPL